MTDPDRLPPALPPLPLLPAARGYGLLLRLGLLGLLTVLLLIPVGWVRGLIHERMQLRAEAEQRVAEGFGAAQLLRPPLLLLEFADFDGPLEGAIERRQRLVLLAEALTASVRLQTEWRHVGIYDIPVYTAQLRLAGRFDGARLQQLRAQHPQLDAGSARLQIGLSDPRGLLEIGRFEFAGQRLLPEPGGWVGGAWFGDQVDLAGTAPLEFAIELQLSGSNSFALLPLARNVALDVAGDWPDPSFVGGPSPRSQAIDASGFRAGYVRNAFQLGLGAILDEAGLERSGVQLQPLRVGLYEPASTYQRNERVGKYALLFVGLTVLGFLCAELLLKVRLHPLHYLLIGAALALFYLLLLALSEHLGFGLSFALAALAICTLLGGYCGAVLGARRRGLLVALLIGLVYGFLYVLVASSELSLLLGALGLGLLLAALMYGTRRIDWYAVELLPQASAASAPPVAGPAA